MDLWVDAGIGAGATAPPGMERARFCFSVQTSASWALGTSSERKPPSAPRPAAASPRPTTMLTTLARRMAAGLVHRPHVMPSVQRPLEKWNTVERMPMQYRIDVSVGCSAVAAVLAAW